MMIGVSMAAAIIICIAAFIWLYVQIGPLLSDFIPQEQAGEEQPATLGMLGADPTADTTAADDFSLAEIPPEPLGTPEATATEDDTADADTNAGDAATDDEVTLDDDDVALDEDVWKPTHQLHDGPNVNFRSGPNTISEPHGSLAPGTPLRFLDEEEPAGGVVWMAFEIEDGTEGWIRDIDVMEIDPEDDDDDADDE
jgi:hypothetical protein